MVDDQGSSERCTVTIIHEDIVEKVRQKMPADECLFNLAELFKVFGDTTRVKILFALFTAEMCVCDITALLGLTQSAVSHQLRVLKQARLVKCRKRGKWSITPWMMSMLSRSLTRGWHISAH